MMSGVTQTNTDTNPYNRRWVNDQLARTIELRALNRPFVQVNPLLAVVSVNVDVVADVAIEALADVFREVRAIKDDDVRAVALDSLQSQITEYLQSGVKPVH